MQLRDEKQSMRREVALLKKGYSPEALRRFSVRIQQRVEQLPLFQQARRIAFYHALPDEVHTADFIEKWRRKKQILLPVVNGDTFSLQPYTENSALRKGAFDIMEPVARQNTAPCDADLIIVPGMAFDRQLNRLGRGKGYYDRFLSEHPAPAIGICFQFQLFDRIPTDSHDRKMTLVVTEEETKELRIEKAFFDRCSSVLRVLFDDPSTWLRHRFDDPSTMYRIMSHLT
ncbi:MAG: 5-formyltetrahydrofolate cyclo-ligase [Tannerella sp.]|jgi:5-formyltetrahydrofolate cyclo-ligase|nr:5-formyltetrahydrofolate cyclo-ligase [Tannerella sp.]